MKPLRKLGALGASLAVAATSLVAAMPAGAETFPIDAILGGGLILHPAEGESVDLPMSDGSTFVGSYDNVSGDLDGTVTITAGIAEVDPGLGIGTADLYYEFIGEGPIFDGTIGPGGEVSFSDIQTIKLTEVSALGGAFVIDLTDNCTFGPLELHYTGDYDFDTGVADVLSDPVTVDPVDDGACGDLTDTINDMLSGASAEANLTFEFAAEPPVTTEPITKLNVLTSPPVASQITVDGLIVDTWGVHDLDVTPGEHVVCFGDVEGFTDPGCVMVDVAEGETVTYTGAFEAKSMLRVTTEPAVNSQITIDGSPANNWGVHGVPVSPGDHVVCFGDVADWFSPGCSVVEVAAGGTTTFNGVFTADPGAPGPDGFGNLRVETSPAVPSEISIDGVVADTWGIDWVQIAPGAHTVCFGSVDGFVAPACETVVVDEGGTAEVRGEFTALGFLDVRNEPGVDVSVSVYEQGNTFRVARGNWGMDIRLHPGNYDVCFGDSAEHGAPIDPSSGCTTVTITPDAVTQAIAVYESIGVAM